MRGEPPSSYPPHRATQDPTVIPRKVPTLKTTHASKRLPTEGTADAALVAAPDRRGDRLVQLPQIVEMTTLTEATLRYLRHKGEGPPMFKLHKRLVAWESDCISWIEAQAVKEAARAS